MAPPCAGCGTEVALAQRRQQAHAHEELATLPGQEAPQAPEPSSWLPTLQHLVARGLPCLFTCYNAQEAEQDAQVRRLAAGAGGRPGASCPHPAAQPLGRLLASSGSARVPPQAVRQAGGKLTLAPALNPYSGLVEFPDVEDPHAFYRSSMHYFCFRGRA